MKWTKRKVKGKWVVEMFYTVYAIRDLEEREVKSVIYVGNEKDANEIMGLLKEVYGEG